MFDDDNHKDYFLDDDDSTDCRDEGNNWGRWDSGMLPSDMGRRETGRSDPDEFDDYDDFAEPEEEKENYRPRESPAVEPIPGRRRGILGYIGCLGVIVLSGLGIGYFRYVVPCADNAVMEVYVRNVERRGVFFKTYEAEVVAPPGADYEEASRKYSGPRPVTIESAELAQRLQESEGSGRPVKLRYRQYYGTLPWRGESKTVVEAIAE